MSGPDDDALAAMAERLVAVEGVEAVLLGGSRATGRARPDSDVDLGVYYRRDRLGLAALQRLADDLSDTDAPVAAPGGWGPWVDGGAWLRVDGVAVDWILRDVDRVREQRDRAIRGEFAFHAQPGHPLGFLDVAYAGEVAVGRILADPRGVIADLRVGLDPYPRRLAEAMVANQWQAGFLLDAAAKGAKRDDVAYVGLCLTTAAMILTHAWHARAGVWVLNEKGLVPGVASLNLDTGGFATAVDASMSALGEGRLTDAIDALRGCYVPSMLFVPTDFEPPTSLAGDGFRLEPLGPEHNDADLAAWTSSIEHIRATPGYPDENGDWPPAEGMTTEENLVDLVRHRADFEARIGFTFTVLDPATDDVIGCVYLYPSPQPGHDVEVQSWVTAEKAHLDGPLADAVAAWLEAEWPWSSPDRHGR